MKRINQSGGFALIEVLLAIVILAIGLLAGSRMQILGLNYTQGATTLTHATMAANDILDRMRLNVDGISNYDGYTTASVPGDQNCDTSACDPAQRAQQDLRMWSRYFPGNDDIQQSAQLPEGTVGSITQSGNLTQVTVVWKDFINGQQTDDQQITIGAAL